MSGPIVVAPVGFSEVGSHNMEIVLWDYSIGTSGKTIDTWQVIVTNSAPFFTVPIMPNISVQMNKPGYYVVHQI